VAGECHAVGDLAERRLDAVAPFGDDLQQAGGHGGALFPPGRDEDGSAAGGLGGGEAAPAEALVGEQVTRGRPGFQQVRRGLALVHGRGHDGPGADDAAARVGPGGEAEAAEPLGVGGVTPGPGGQVVARPGPPSGPRTRDGCFTGSADVSACWQSSSGSRAARMARSCSNAPRSQRVLRLAALWHGRTGNRCPRSRAASARNPDSLRRPSRCRTCAIASSSASVQAGAGPGLRGIGSPRTGPGREPARRRRRADLQLADADEQIFSWQHGGRPLRTRDFDNHLSSAGAAPISSRHARINPHNSPQR
jgi:hypothetical protein